MTRYAALTYHNTLLAALAADDLALLAPHFEAVEFALHDVLVRPGAPIPFVYFPKAASPHWSPRLGPIATSSWA